MKPLFFTNIQTFMNISHLTLLVTIKLKDDRTGSKLSKDVTRKKQWLNLTMNNLVQNKQAKVLTEISPSFSFPSGCVADRPAFSCSNRIF